MSLNFNDILICVYLVSILIAYHDKLQLYPTVSMIPLLLHEFEAKPRMSVNNKDIIQMHLEYNWLTTQRLYQSMFL